MHNFREFKRCFYWLLQQTFTILGGLSVIRSGFLEASRPANLLFCVPIGSLEQKEAGPDKEMRFLVCVYQSSDGAEWRAEPLNKPIRSNPAICFVVWMLH